MAQSESGSESEWADWTADGEDEAVNAQTWTCLLCADGHRNPQDLFAHCKSAHSLDVLALCSSHGLDQYGCIRLVNYIRTLAKDGGATTATLASLDPAAFSDERFLIPVIPGDALLQYEFVPESDWEDEEDEEGAAPRASKPEEEKDEQLDETALLRKRLAVAEAEVAKVKQAYHDFREAMKQQVLGISGDGAESGPETGSESGSEDEEDKEFGKLDGYFLSYSHYGIHEQMLQDTVRTEAYRDFMYKNPTLFKDKIVLDVGCGTGILSMFAARAGAKHVYGIDNSEIIKDARAIVRENGLSDVVTLIRGKVEETTLPVDKVDIIVSEWMGYFLLFESMLDTVIFARDKWLAPSGVVHPDQAGMYLVALDDTCGIKERIDYWDDVYGFKMPCMKRHIIREADVCIMDPAAIMSAPCTLKQTNIMEIKATQQDFVTPFQLVIQRAQTCTALLSYFDIVFEAGCENPVVFSTGADVKPTHWKQTVFYLSHPMEVQFGDIIEGTLTCKRSKANTRGLHVIIEYKGGNLKESVTQTFPLD